MKCWKFFVVESECTVGFQIQIHLGNIYWQQSHLMAHLLAVLVNFYHIPWYSPADGIFNLQGRGTWAVSCSITKAPTEISQYFFDGLECNFVQTCKVPSELINNNCLIDCYQLWYMAIFRPGDPQTFYLVPHIRENFVLVFIMSRYLKNNINCDLSFFFTDKLMLACQHAKLRLLTWLTLYLLKTSVLACKH